MKKFAIFSVCVMLLFSVLMMPVTSQASDAITFTSLWPSGTMSSVEGSGNVSYQNGVLTIVKESGMTYAPIVSANIKTFLGESAFTAPYTAKFTMHVEVKIPSYSAGTTIKAGMMIGAGVNGGGNLFQLTDGEQTGTPRILRVQHHANIGAGAYATSAVPSGENFVADQWISMDVLVDLSAEQATFYVNNNLVGTVDCRAGSFGNAGWRVGFLGYKGVSFRNMKVSKGLVTPSVVTPPSATPVTTPSVAPSAVPSATATTAPAPTAASTQMPAQTEIATMEPDATASVTTEPVPTNNDVVPSTVAPSASAPDNVNPETSDGDYTYLIIIAGILLVASIVFAVYRSRKDRVRSSEE